MRTLLRTVAVSTALLIAAPATAQVAPASGAPADVRAPSDLVVLAPAGTRGAGPNGATLRCRDGSHPAPGAADAACADKGGVAARYPLIPIPGAPPAEQRAAARRAASEAAQKKATAAEVRAAPPTVGPRNATVVPVEPRPADATLLCNDGTVIRADTTATRCATHGGLKGRFTPRPRQ
jgi:hypothetical protein